MAIGEGLNRIRAFLAQFPQVSHEDEGSIITINAKDEQGYDIILTEEAYGYKLFLGDWSAEFNEEDSNSEEEMMNYFRLALTSHFRLKLSYKFKSPYLATLEYRVKKRWEEDSITRLRLDFFVFWRKNRVEYRQNNWLELSDLS